MGNASEHFSVKKKMYIFVVLTVLAVAFGTSAIAFQTSANQIDDYYKLSTADNAKNFASMVDGDYLLTLRKAIESEEYQTLREKAVEKEDESMIEGYLKDNGLWDGYYDISTRLTEYLGNMDSLKYLYVVAHGDKDAERDMYLIDDESTELFETGMYEEREEELRGIDLTDMGEPRISQGDWGWLCSAFSPVYASDGTCVCVVGCDIGMDDVMQERRGLLILLIIGSLLFVAAVLTFAMLFITKVVVNPLHAMTQEMKQFTPAENISYDDACVINLEIKSRDEIYEIYEGIRSMQINIIDHLNDLSALQKENKKVEDDIKVKEEEIGQLNIKTYRDALTGVGNKAAYIKQIDELNSLTIETVSDFGIVMVDMNNLKQINDTYGHKSGDIFIKGCCNMVCDAFKHSPVYRIGGDEFVVILTGTDYEHRVDIVERLKKDYINCYEQTSLDPWLRYSAAVGMSELKSDDDALELVFRRADKAMYVDKEEFKKKYGGYR